MSLATSGNYLNKYYVDDSLFFHTINPKSGYPAYTNMLSASVFSDNCLTADAYATAFMAMNFKDSKRILNSLDNLLGYFIYMDNGEARIYISDGLKPYIYLLMKNKFLIISLVLFLGSILFSAIVGFKYGFILFLPLLLFSFKK